MRLANLGRLNPKEALTKWISPSVIIQQQNLPLHLHLHLLTPDRATTLSLKRSHTITSRMASTLQYSCRLISKLPSVSCTGITDRRKGTLPFRNICDSSINSRLPWLWAAAHLHYVTRTPCLQQNTQTNRLQWILRTNTKSTGSSKEPTSVSKVSWHGHTKHAETTADVVGTKFGFIAARNMAEKVDFGILFDIDGVIARGSQPLTAAKRMIKLLTNNDNELVVPIAFCTNSTGLCADKAASLSKWLNIQIKPEQVIPSQGPLSVFRKYHNQRALFVGQGKLREIAKELGFTNVVTIDEVKDAFPLLDIVDHSNRVYIAQNGIDKSHGRDDFKHIEVVVLIGEPNKWETHLQLLVDLLLTGGYPAFAPEGGFPTKHIPVLACNMDLVFMAEACMPRFGHGAFLVCLESLFKKITGTDLQYAALMGKPSEITFRYAEHCIAETARKIGIEKDIRTLYIVGDNPEVDVYGANLYNQYIKDCQRNEKKQGTHTSRQVPTDYDFREQTASKCYSYLVETGVYDPKIGRIEDQEMGVYHHGHRDFEKNNQLSVPSVYSTDVYDAVLNILERELGIPNHINNNIGK